MRKAIRFVLLIVTASLCGCVRNEPTSIEYVPTPGETATVDLDADDGGARKIAVECWPTEVYYGDPVYVVMFDKNVSEAPIHVHGIDGDQRFDDCISASSPSISYEYYWKLPRAPWNIKNYISDYITVPYVLKPNERRLNARLRLEFPPLREMEDPFWTAFEESTPPEGRECRLKIVVNYRDCDDRVQNATFAQDILVKPRPRAERELLATWFNETKSKLPTRDANGSTPPSDYPSDSDINAHGADDIRIGWSSYNPWLFIPYGYRKPSIPNCPTTLDGWRELEASMMPSTMRDEIRLTRLQLEYYSAKKGAAAEKAQAELIDWLASLPEPQQFVMTTFLLSRQREFSETALRDKNRALLDALRERLDSTGFLR